MSHGKICKIIIDYRSFDNLVSYEMVNKPGLKKYPIDRPYRASWVSDAQNIVVRKQEIVDFSIGEYKDQVICDVIPMTCCHVILGRRLKEHYSFWIIKCLYSTQRWCEV